ncbi:antibiotic biosynthesis monooxygenase [Streptomyces gilvus]|uniref:antibiotic biosynthesis monooxygenase n=1 Tax=Streptomyces gilvus TaxID=2920937 RepID=UPI001F0FBB2F|nr:antibiotic biosynthesis monooxygenase [Streptomyces sp. CME 23]MCH5671243.1 antibiotic biosynthesis monooxygenase [Streptomyces sp. CME 23]
MSTTELRRGEPVTTVLTWQVRPGHEREFEEWTEGVTRCARRFPGNEGVSWLRPEDGHRYHAVLRWSDPHRLTRWLESAERARWHERIEGVATEVGSERQSTTGLETWFSLPGTTVQSPPRWKMVLTTFLGAYPFTLLVQALVTPRTTAWPLPLRAAVFPLVLLPVLTYLVMPLLSRMVRQWLYRQPDE